MDRLITIAINERLNDCVERLALASTDINEVDGNGNTILHYAVSKNVNVSVIKSLVKSGANPLLLNHSLYAPATVALNTGCPQFIHELRPRMLLDRHCDTLALNDQLLLWCFLGSVEDVERLIARGADMECITACGNTPLMIAASQGNMAVIESLLNSGARVDAANVNGETALSLACEHGSTKPISRLLDFGANVNGTDKDGFTPLMSFAFSSIGCLETARLLIDRGADVFACDFDGKSAILYALYSSNSDLAELLAAQGAARDRHTLQKCYRTTLFGDNTEHLAPLFAALGAERGVIEAVMSKDQAALSRILFPPKSKRKPAIEELNEALMLAASNQMPVSIARSLLEAGADPGMRDSCGRCLALNAVRNLNWDLLAWLIDNGWDTSTSDTSGRSLLMNCCRPGGIPLAERLIQTVGIDEINRRSITGATALSCAAWLGSFDLCKLLVSHGAEVNAVDAKGRTALHNAAQWAHIVVVDFLIRAGARTDISDSEGITPYDFAKIHMDKHMCWMLGKGNTG